jgi:putative intracellular protease/amidase
MTGFRYFSASGKAVITISTASWTLAGASTSNRQSP